MIGIVVVSHSRALGNAVAALAAEMVAEDARPALRVAAGLDETTFGTDAAAIAEAIQQVDSPDGVLVLVDLGSAVLSAQMALEFVDPELAGRTRVSSAPLVEGLIAALVTASTGASLDEVAAEARHGLVGKQEQLDDADVPAAAADAPAVAAPDPSARTFAWTIRNPHGLHARPAAALVSGLRGLDASVMLSNATLSKGPVSAGSLTSVQTLGLRKGDQMTAVISGPQAHEAYDRLAGLAQDDFGEREAPTAVAVKVAAPETGQTGRQIAIGPVRHVAIDPDTSGYVPGDAAVEADRLARAVAQVEQVLATGAGGDIYAVQGLILADEETQAHLRAAIAQGSPATDAVRAWFAAAADGLEALDDPYLKARAEDQRGVQRMLLRALCGQQVAPGAAEGVLVLDELDPVTAGSLDAQRCLGVVTLAGGATGHGAILAQARGFALATGHAEVAQVPDGTVVAIDPVDNRVWVAPDQALLAQLRDRQAAREAEAADAERLAAQPALTRSGRRVLVEANLSSVADAVAAATAGAEGSGLVRTEVLFGGWDHAPSAQEQADVFVQLGRALPAGVITVRTWDPGGDKPLAFLPQDPETNPMLGERGVRAMRRLPDLLDTQLTAILLASREVNVRVMFPMITLPDEMVWARERLAAVQARVGGQVDVGMMVETPAAAVRAGDFVGVADFISVGTNDLTQYTMAVDRGNAGVASIAAGENLPVYDLIGLAARAFAGRPVAVCGDLASRPACVARLIALGVTELSVRPPLVGTIKQAVRAAA